MREFRADLHIHSRYSRATSSRLNPATLSAWAAIKGLDVLGTGDFTHPAWRAELKEQLAFDENSGLYRLVAPQDAHSAMPEWRDWLERSPLPGGPLFMLQAEISSIYKHDGKVRKVHNLVFMPDFASAEKFSLKLGELGNVNSDGRPILGLSSHDLLELVLESHPQAFLVPAHVWTPWFSLFGSKSGYDRLEDCFGDLAEHIFALETGLSSDPAMNRTISALDKYRMLSNSDAHSGENLGREANIFSGQPSYSGIYQALRGNDAGASFLGTLEFFPDEGKYHLDGHRDCKVALAPEETRKLDGRCPVCGKPLTVGVLSRVMDLADRDEPARLDGEKFDSLIPLPEIIGEVLGVGAKSRKVADAYFKLVHAFGPELDILRQTPEADLARFYPPLAEGITRMREGRVFRQGGYDGEYGVIRVFTDAERREFTHGGSLVKMPEPAAKGLALMDGLPLAGERSRKPRGKKAQGGGERAEAEEKRPDEAGDPDGDFEFHSLDGSTIIFPEEKAQLAGSVTEEAEQPGGLNKEQEQAVLSGPGPVLVLAGPGSGKTRTLVARVEQLVREGINPKHILAVTFTRRAAAEMDARLAAALGPGSYLPRTDTLHALALEAWMRLYSESPLLLSEENAFRVFADANPKEPQRKLVEIWREINLCRERLALLPVEVEAYHSRYALQKNAWNLLDYTDLIEFWLQQAQSGKYAKPWLHVLVDEIQDLSPLQLTLVKHLLPANGDGFFGIGDPNQSVYGFRGAHGEAEHFFRLAWPSLHSISLTQNYRSAPRLVELSSALLYGDGPGRRMTAKNSFEAEIRMFDGNSAESEGTWIAGEILRLLGTGSHTIDDARKRKTNRNKEESGQESALEEGSFTPGDFAVLVRARNLILPVQRALHRAGIPYGIPLADAFWEDRRAAKILDAAGRMLGIGGIRLSADEHGLGVAPRLKDNLNPGISPYEFARALPGDEEDGPISCPEKVLMRGPLAVAAYLDNTPPFDQAFWKSQAFKGLLKGFEAHKGWPGLLNWVSLQNELELVRGRSEKVQIMTLHASKGLEFPVVFIPALEDGLLPFMGSGLLSGHPERPSALNADLEEELRLFYVGVTRAQKGLFLSRAARRFLFGHELRLQPSRFLSRLPKDFIKRSRPSPARAQAEKQLSLF